MRFATRTNQYILDGLILSFAYWLSFMLRFEGTLDQRYSTMLLITLPYAVLLHFLSLQLSGSLRISWRFISLKDVLRIILALSISCTLLLISRAFFGDLLPTLDFSAYTTIPYGVILINLFLNILGITGLRAIHRIIVEHHQLVKHGTTTPKSLKRTLLIGAGDSGATIIKEISARPDLGMIAVGFLDDDKRKIGTTILGYKVLATIDQLNSICEKEHVDQILITINDISAPQMRRLSTLCQSTSLPTKIIPGVHELVNGNLSLQKIRPVSIDDLLGRKAVKLDLDLIAPFLENKVILVTGAGGSIGSELCRQISLFKPHALLLLEQAENPLFAINNELIAQDINTIPLIADITDRPRIESIFQQFSPDIVFHAAAHKHVPLMEANPQEAIKNNVSGTRIMAETADKFNVDSFLMISTDKAVNPSSIMGASKRIAELVIQSIAQNSKTKFVAVRFGNVLGSSGSVIPTFIQQIKNGGPVTVTHPDMRRYFMTIPEACQLVLEAISIGEGGEIFILDMGSPVKILDLARDLISLSGFRPEVDIKIVFSGIRPGEKLFEELSVAKENADKTKHPKIFIGHITPPENYNEFLTKVSHLEEMAKQNSENIFSLIKEIVPEYIGKKMDDRLKKQTIKHFQHLSVLKRLDKVLKENNINYFVLKGLNLAYVYWHDPYSRPLGDIDLFIHKNDIKQTILLLKSVYKNLVIGEEFFKNKPLNRYNEKLVLDGVTIELHWDLSPYCKYPIEEDSFFNNIEYFKIENNLYPGLNATFLLLALIIHAGKSYFSDLSNKQYTDLFLVLTKGTINYDLLFSELKSTGSMKTAKVILFILREHRNYLLPTGILPDISQIEKTIINNLLLNKFWNLPIISFFKKILFWLILSENRKQFFKSIILYMHSM